MKNNVLFLSSIRICRLLLDKFDVDVLCFQGPIRNFQKLFTKFQFRVQWNPFNGIVDNRIKRIMGSIQAVLANPTCKTCSLAVEKGVWINEIIWLQESISPWPKVVLLIGTFWYLICNFSYWNSQNCSFLIATAKLQLFKLFKSISSTNQN